MVNLGDYHTLFDNIRQRTGLRVKKERFEQAVQVIDRILNAADMTSTYELWHELENRPITAPFWQDIIQGFTVGETYFFRNQAHIRALRTVILPQLIQKRRNAGHQLLRFWSAGCATGEEPYTLAMLLHELIPDIEHWHITLLATDINLAYLARARQGLYRPASFRSETPHTIRQRWFTPSGSEYQLDRTIRDMVYFAPLNLAEDTYPAFENGTMKMDMIMCRNVTIYFDQPVVAEIARRFYQALNPNSWLIVGHSEPMAATYPQFVARNIEQAVFYHKEAVPDVYSPIRPMPAAEVESAPVSGWEPTPISTPPAPAKPRALPPSNTDQPDTKQMWQRAKAAADREKWDEALDWISLAERENNMLPEFHYLRGLVQSLMAEADAALWSMRQAIYCDPTFVMAHYNLGELYRNMHETKLAIRHWRRAQTLIADKNPHHHLPFADDLTVEMLQTILAHRLKSLSA